MQRACIVSTLARAPTRALALTVSDSAQQESIAHFDVDATVHLMH